MNHEADAYSSLVDDVRQALHNLYDPRELQKNRLNRLLGLDAQGGSTALRQVLLEAVEALKPRSTLGDESRAWRAYRVLVYRYVEQFPRADVARTLGLSIRQYTREDARAVRMLADYLMSHHQPATQTAETLQASGPSVQEELEWIQQSLPNEAIAVPEAIDAVLKTVEPLLRALNVHTKVELPTRLPAVAGQGATLRQALLNVVTALARSVPLGTLVIRATTEGQRLFVSFQANPAQGASLDLQREHADSLEMAGRLLNLMSGTVTVLPPEKNTLTVCLSLATAEQIPVLVIDDNADTLQLYHRYLAGTRYPVFDCQDPQQTVHLAQTMRPRIIVLDVMLPGIDGWELLQRLREDQITRGMPVIVCSILPEERLALTLGAAAYVRKPVSRADFLAALDRQAALLGQGSCA